jgi:nitrate reductase NapAB chaperone NapD
VGALRFQAREIVQDLADINECPLHSRANQATIAVIIQADPMNRIQDGIGSIDYIEQFEGSAA